jgi:hypothetical protein
MKQISNPLELRTEIKRQICLGALISSTMGFVSSFWFYDTYAWSHTTTVYIPFLWNIGFTNASSVLNLFYYFTFGCFVIFGISAYSLGRLK